MTIGRTILRVMGHWAMLLTLMALLIVDAFTLPHGAGRELSTVGGWLQADYGGPIEPPHLNFFAYRTADGFSIEFVLGQPSHGAPAAWGVIERFQSSTGFWAITKRSVWYPVWWLDGAKLTPADEKMVLDALADTLASAPALHDDWFVQAWIQAYRTGTLTQSEPVWAGYVHDAIVAGVVVVLACGGVGVVKRRWTSVRAARRIRRGMCGSCGYDLKGSPGVVCPECGAAGKGVVS